MSQLNAGTYQAVLFDLDGTLIDTAPDMVGVLQALQSDNGLSPVAYELGRSYVSNGAVGLLRLGFPDAFVRVAGNHEIFHLEARQNPVLIFVFDRREKSNVTDHYVWPGKIPNVNQSAVESKLIRVI